MIVTINLTPQVGVPAVDVAQDVFDVLVSVGEDPDALARSGHIGGWIRLERRVNG